MFLVLGDDVNITQLALDVRLYLIFEHLGREISQPTIVDPIAFDQWRTEAFALWHEQWGQLYDVDSTSRYLLK